MMKTLSAVLIAVLGIIGSRSVGQTRGKVVCPSDSLATIETISLYTKLFEVVKRGTMVGHQDDLAYGHDWYGEDARSDVKEVTGDYPAVVGWELGNIELGRAYNLDSVYFDAIRGYVQQTEKRGGISTFSWHANNLLTSGNAWDIQNTAVVRSILPEGAHHEAYLRWLDILADFFGSLKDERGAFIPVVFRPYHEHTGSWFWWGADHCTAAEYKALWRMTVHYFREKKQMHHLLYCYSPSEVADMAHFLERYPGDDVVDIVAFDCYVQGQGTTEDLSNYRHSMERNIAIVKDYAKQSRKIAAIGETGFEGVKDSTYFTKTIYPLLKDKPLAWILFWRNAYEMDKRNHYYLPFAGHPAAPDFKKFVQQADVFLASDLTFLCR